MPVIVLSDSLFRAHKSAGIKMHQIRDEMHKLQTLLCVASGGSLIMDGGSYCSDCAIGLMVRALTKPEFRCHFAAEDPFVRIIAINAAQSTAVCRGGNEQFSHVVSDRMTSNLIKRLETQWTICDLEDVVQQRDCRRRWPELEACNLRDPKGIYGQRGDNLHFRKDIAKAACDELLKAVYRTAMRRYSDELSAGNVLLVLAAGWNTNWANFNSLDRSGHCWRKAELVAATELCALNGHRLSVLTQRMQDLIKQAEGRHSPFLATRVELISAVDPLKSGQKRKVLDKGFCDFPGLAEKSSSGGSVDGTSKRARIDEQHLSHAAFIAEAASIPIGLAAERLVSVGYDVSEALLNPMFRPSETQSQASSRQTPISDIVSIDLSSEEDDFVGFISSFSCARDRLKQLTDMGFTKVCAETALHNSKGCLEGAIECLLVQA